MLAEDNPVNQQIANIILSKCGCVVKKAKDGLEAVETFLNSLTVPDFESRLIETIPDSVPSGLPVEGN